MKKLLKMFLVFLLAFALIGCGNSSSGNTEKEYIASSEIESVYANPNNYKNKYINLTGKVFIASEITSDGETVFQMWGDPVNANKNTLVYVKTDETFAIDDFVKIDGEIAGEFKGTNNFGGDVTALMINATSIEKIPSQDLLAPTTKEITPNLVQEQSGIKFTVDKVQFAKEETRVFVTIVNNSGAEYSFYNFNSRITQNGTQFDYEANYEAKYKEINSSILSGITSDGILTFPPIDPTNFDLHLDGFSHDYELDIEAFVFNIIVE